MKHKEKYPELEKIKLNQELSQNIGAFIDYLRNEKEIVFCRYSDKRSPAIPVPDYTSTDKILAEYFGIDLVKAEKERKEILKSMK